MRQPPLNFRSQSDIGIEGIQVRLWEPMGAQQAANTIASFYLSTWDDPIHAHTWNENEALRARAWKYAQDAMSGKVLPNTLESIPLTFSISGISRATTHQLVRSRVGAVFGQQGGRDNNWTDFNLRIPETWSNTGILHEVEEFQKEANRLYEKALRAGVPFQDARYVLPMGLETSLVASYNLLSFKSLAERRLCNRMMWETNHVVRMMTDLVVQFFPFVGKNLRSSCEKRGVCGSVSPMFPASCWSAKDKSLAKNNPTLEAEVKDKGGYDWPLSANGCWLHYGETLDPMRLDEESRKQEEVLALTEPIVPIIEKKEGLWKNVE